MDKAEIVKLFVDFNRTLTAYLDVKFEDVMRIKHDDENDSAAENEQGTPEYVE